MTASVADVRTLLDEARRKGYSGGVLGLRAQPRWDGPESFDHAGMPVQVVACESALAVREALQERTPDRWLVVVTDRDVDDLGTGITAHLIGHRLRRPDPWDAVRAGFRATGLEHGLVAGGRSLAAGLLVALGEGPWPPARGGTLTRDHALGTLAAARLGLDDPAALDARALLRWTLRPDATARLAALRGEGGDTVADAVLHWAADRSGAVGSAVHPLLVSGRVAEVVPLGLAVELALRTPTGSVPRDRLDRDVFGGSSPDDHVLAAWAAESVTVVEALLADTGADDGAGAATAVLARADTASRDLRVGDRVAASTVLPAGLAARLDVLGRALAAACSGAEVRARAGGADAPLVDADGLDTAERAWASVRDHRLATDGEPRVTRAQAGVRLVRWLAAGVPAAVRLGDLVGRHRDADAWVDRAAAEAWLGVPDESLSLGLRSTLAAVRLRRDAHDRAFAAALARETEADAAPLGYLRLEDVLAERVLPLASSGHAVLLLVLDGMSMANATGIVDAITARAADGWFEALPEQDATRVAAVSVLPSVTEQCRTSLLSGELRSGGQREEQDGFARLCLAAGVRGELLHKAALEVAAPGHQLAPPVADAVDDTTGRPLVACVLNTIDDALDRSDPGGTDWRDDDVKHLHPLLARARRAGRIVVLTSDHGHVVERRTGRVLAGVRHLTTSNRFRAVGSGPTPGEVEVRGRRVLADGGRAVLAVDPDLRYSTMKAGYHGGASPAEVVVPVVVLVPGSEPEGWRLAPPQAPDWWRGPTGAAAPAASVRRPVSAVPRPGPAPTLFDPEPFDPEPFDPEPFDPEPLAPEPPAPEPLTPVTPAESAARLADAVLASQVYAAQRARGSRLSVTDRSVRGLLVACLRVPDRRVSSESAAAALAVAEVSLRGAVGQVQRLLNVDAYAVVSLDPLTRTVVLDETLLREQFGVDP